MNKEVIVIGAGAAGMESAGQLANEGFSVKIFEKDESPGGHLKGWYHLFPNRRDSVEVMDYLLDVIDRKEIELLTNTTVTKVSKKDGKFVVTTTQNKEYNADAIIVTTGFDLFRSERKEEYGYGIYANVITSAELEKMFRNGNLRCTDGRIPQKVGFIHCVGSRDEKVGNFYCSKLCCVSAVKQAIEIREHVPESNVFCFYMDIRMGGSGYEELYRESQQKYGVNYIRGKVSEVAENYEGKLVLKVEDTLVGKPLKMEFDMLVLMVGMEMSESGKELAVNSGLLTGENRFFAPADHHFGSNKGNVDGIFYAGACTATMNLTETLAHARSAVDDVVDYFRRKK